MSSKVIVNFDTVVVIVEGKLEQQESESTAAEIVSRLSNHVKNITIDFSLAEHISSYGVFTLTTLKEKVNKLGGEFQVINVPESIKKVLTLLNFTDNT